MTDPGPRQVDPPQVCLDCGAKVIQGNECPDHPGEPLLDPGDPEVLIEMDRIDSGERARVYWRWVTIGAVIGMAYGLPIAWFFLFEIVEDFEVVGGVAVLLALPAIWMGKHQGRRRFKAKFDEWTGQGHVELDV